MTTYPVTTGESVTATNTTTSAGPVPGRAETSVSATDSHPVDSGVKAPAVDQGVKTPAVDTVTLQGKVRDAVKVNPKQGNDTIGGRIGAVVFVYTWKGDLRIRYMDSKNSLVYQSPPVMMARTADLMRRPNSSVSARI